MKIIILQLILQYYPTQLVSSVDLYLRSFEFKRLKNITYKYSYTPYVLKAFLE